MSDRRWRGAPACSYSLFSSWPRCAIWKSWSLSMNHVAQPSRLRVAAASRRQHEHPARRLVNSQARTPALRRRASASAEISVRFMTATHVNILEVFPFHEPSLVWSSAFRRLGVAPAKAGTPNTAQFMAPIRVQILEVLPAHEPERGL